MKYLVLVLALVGCTGAAPTAKPAEIPMQAAVDKAVDFKNVGLRAAKALHSMCTEQYDRGLTPGKLQELDSYCLELGVAYKIYQNGVEALFNVLLAAADSGELDELAMLQATQHLLEAAGHLDKAISAAKVPVP